MCALQSVISHFQYPGVSLHSIVFPSTSHTHIQTQIDSDSMKKDDAIEDDDNSHLTFTNLLGRYIEVEEGKRKGGEEMDRSEAGDTAEVEEGDVYITFLFFCSFHNYIVFILPHKAFVAIILTKP